MDPINGVHAIDANTGLFHIPDQCAIVPIVHYSPSNQLYGANALRVWLRVFFVYPVVQIYTFVQILVLLRRLSKGVLPLTMSLSILDAGTMYSTVKPSASVDT